MRGKGLHHLKKEVEKLVRTSQKILKDIEAMSAKQPHEDVGGPRDVIAVYCEAWKQRYGANPKMSKAQIGQITRLLNDFDVKSLGNLIRAYLRMNDSWFMKRNHDLVTFSQNITSIGRFHDTGKQITNTKIRETDRMQHLFDMNERVKRGEL